MIKKMILGAVVGGILAYLWLTISWVLLPWHEKTIKSFKNERFVSWVFRENAPKKGVYLLPNFHQAVDSDENDASDDQRERRMQGPFIFAAVTPQGLDFSSPWPHISTILAQIFSAGIVCYVLSLLQSTVRYFNRLMLVILIALFAGMTSKVALWAWWGFTAKFIVVEIADILISWFFAGLVLVQMIKPSNSR